MLCKKCKKEIPDGSAFCNLCGARQGPQPHSAHSRPNGSGTAYKRGRTWTGKAAGYTVAELGPDGQRILRRSRPTRGGFATKAEALRWADSFGAETDAGTVTLAQLWAGWSANDMTKLSKDKQLAYKKARERLEPIMGRRIASLTLDDLQGVVNEKSISYYTARDMKNLLSHLYKRAMATGSGRGAVTVNLSRFIVLPDLEEHPPEPFSEAEVVKLWDAWAGGEMFVGYILLMIYTSMMPGELMQCRKSMIDWERREIYGAGLKTKKRKDTPIVLPEFILPVLEAICASSKSDKVLPYSEDRFRRAYHKTLAASGVRDLPPYSCRHTTATAAVKKGVALSVVKEIMRHSKLSSTERYVHVGSEAAHAAVNQLRDASEK